VIISIGCGGKQQQQIQNIAKEEQKIMHEKEKDTPVMSQQEILQQKNMHLINAQNYRANRMYDKAVHELKEAIKLSPEDASLYYMLGHLYEEMDKNKESVEMFIKAMKLDPSIQATSTYTIQQNDITVPYEPITGKKEKECISSQIPHEYKTTITETCGK
jgi:tetratricopeptide (TPR) repeat protein